MYVTAIVLAAGKGLRLKSKIPKPLIKINSQPLIIYSLNTLGKHPYIKDIIVVANPRNLQDLRKTIKRFRINKIKDVVLGGQVRQASVVNGLKAMDNHTGLVLIHDAARPFIDRDIVSSVIKIAESYGAAIVGVPVKATIKEVVSCPMPAGRQELSPPQRSAGPPRILAEVVSKFVVKKTLNRSNLWEIQTPQVFRKDLILKAYDKFGDIDVTDDAMLAEKIGAKVSVVLGTYNNIKITTPEDLILAEAIAHKWNIA